MRFKVGLSRPCNCFAMLRRVRNCQCYYYYYWKVTRLSDERMCAGREFQLLGEDTQKAREAKDDLTQEGTARRLPIIFM